MTSISVVVPVYNSRETLDELVSRLTQVLKVASSSYEIILVNDGSRDDSWSVIAAIVARNPEVRGIDLMRNYGQSNAVLAGVRAATGDVIVTLDDDLQHPPEAIPTLLDALELDCDLVYGTPIRQRHGWWRDAAATTSKSALGLLVGWGDAVSVTDLRVFRARLRDGFDAYQAPKASFDALLAWTTNRIKHVPVEHAPRRVGRSNYRLATLADYTATMATAYSTRPLRLIAALGLLLTVGGLVATSVSLVTNVVNGDPILGRGLVVALLFLLTGLQLFGIGVIGEYVGRAHERLLAKPTYVVRTTLGDANRAGQSDRPRSMPLQPRRPDRT